MKKINLVLVILIGLGLFSWANAQRMQMMYPRINNNLLTQNQQSQLNWDEVVNHTKQEEQEGKEIWEKLKNKEIDCNELKDSDFASLGEYFMGQMFGESHPAMNLMMMQMHGKDGEEQMHILMGQKLSGCISSSTSIASSAYGFMPMMNMMGFGGLNNGAWSTPFNNYMMGFGYPMMSWGFGWLGFIFMILFWVLIVVGVIALIKWLTGQFKNENQNKSALEILKERYAKGEIDKKEFEEKKKGLA